MILYGHAPMVATERQDSSPRRHHRCVRLHRRRAAPVDRRAPRPRLDVATGDSMAGRRAADLYPSLATAYPDLVFSEFDLAAIDGLDLVFLGLPHQASMELAPQLVGRVGCVVDLSAAFRLKDASHYPTYYGFEHTEPDLLADAVFGLPELHRDELVGASLIATPGCHVTAATLALRPLVEAGLVESSGIDRQQRHRHHGCRPQPDRDQRVHQHRLERRCLRAHAPSAHARDGAGDRRAGDLHPAPRPDESRHPRHLLRPTHGELFRRAGDDRTARRSTPTSRSPR